MNNTKTDPFAKLTQIMLNLPRLVIFQEIKKFFAKNSEKKIVRTGIIIAVVIIFVTILLLVVLNLIGKARTNNFTPIPTPSASPFVEKDRAFSRYATDSAILKMEEDLNKLEVDLGSVDLREVGLKVPTLDFDVEYKK